MMLDRNGLIDLAIHRYFLALNTHDLTTVSDALAEDSFSDMVNAGFLYSGKANLVAHLDDFLKTFAVVHFHDFRTIVDVEGQSIVVLFVVELVDHDGKRVTMRNINCFFANAQGLIGEIKIYTSTGVTKSGFSVGRDYKKMK